MQFLNREPKHQNREWKPGETGNSRFFPVRERCIETLLISYHEPVVLSKQATNRDV
jgi:hypothetical protein